MPLHSPRNSLKKFIARLFDVNAASASLAFEEPRGVVVEPAAPHACSGIARVCGHVEDFKEPVHVCSRHPIFIDGSPQERFEIMECLQVFPLDNVCEKRKAIFPCRLCIAQCLFGELRQSLRWYGGFGHYEPCREVNLWVLSNVRIEILLEARRELLHFVPGPDHEEIVAPRKDGVDVAV